MSKRVVDASVITGWVLKETLPDPVVKLFKAMFEGEVVFEAPKLLFYEVMNAIKSAILSGRIKESDSGDFLDRFGELGVRLADQTVKDRILELSLKKNISVYDAAYVALAERLKCEFVSLDEKLVKKV
ncbi:type II toxin-antitoxin system VapC family toxin [Candidatus Amesbacteria bacterium]|nr:type II toxin-antitoxin system VapC family toxin [Candidatus Amesbacteria bacterium]MBI2587538.1 type II toxin-antitoxin system VapC family toxin [Candidatus Amesbacteria bacterium]